MKDCESYREKISCLIDGELDEAQRSEIQEHIGSCAECAAVYKAFASLSAALADDMQEPPVDLTEKVMKAINEKPAKKRSPWLKILPAAACAAIVVIAGVKTGVFGTQSEKTDQYSAVIEETAPIVRGEQTEKNEMDSLKGTPDTVSRYDAAGAEVSMPNGDTVTVSNKSVTDMLADMGYADSYADFVPQSEPYCELSFELDGKTVYCELFIDGDKVYANFGSGFVLLDVSPDEIKELVK